MTVDSESKIVWRIEQEIAKVNSELFDRGYPVEFSMEIVEDHDTDEEYLALVKCIFDPNNEDSPSIEVLDRLGSIDTPPHMVALPFQFAIERAVKQAYNDRRNPK